MPRIPKIVGVPLNSKQGLWRDVAVPLKGRWSAPPLRSSPGRVTRAKARSVSTARLLRAFREEDETG